MKFIGVSYYSAVGDRVGGAPILDIHDECKDAEFIRSGLWRCWTCDAYIVDVLTEVPDIDVFAENMDENMENKDGMIIEITYHFRPTDAELTLAKVIDSTALLTNGVHEWIQKNRKYYESWSGVGPTG